MATTSRLPGQESAPVIGTDWTVQPFNEVAGQQWFALQERSADGEVKRQLTGYRSELSEVASQLNVTPRELPAATQTEFFAQHFQNPNDRDYELGRQFASDRSAGLPLQYAPVSLENFIRGVEIRESEIAIRQQVIAPHQPYTINTSDSPQTELSQAATPSVLRQDVDRGSLIQADEFVRSHRSRVESPQQDQDETHSLGYSI